MIWCRNIAILTAHMDIHSFKALLLLPLEMRIED